MDEDELNYEELNELESHLYAQIHHEAVKEPIQTIPQEPSPNQPPTTIRTVTNSSVINKPSTSNRYWSVNDNQTTKQVNRDQLAAKKPTVTVVECITLNAATTEKPSQENITNTIESLHSEPNTPNGNSSTKAPSTSNSQNKNTNSKTTFNNNNPFRKTKDMLVNPLNPKVKSKNKQLKHPHHSKLPPSPPNILKNGPFASQLQKLNKAKTYEAKKQKAHKARAKNKYKQTVTTIDLISDNDDNDSDLDDVIVIPTEAPPTYMVQDSDDEVEHIKPLEENAMDACDVDMKFAKPQNNENLAQLDNSSRCTSPNSSVMSSDDFIGQSDRCRLLQGSGVADDEDLLLLTADVDGMMETATSKKSQDNNNQTTRDLCSEEDNSNSMQPPSNSVSAILARNKYRVEQTEFRALDVYESESDITDTVYSKGTPKPTIIRNLNSSSNEEDDVEIIPMNRKAKKLRKRQASGSNKESSNNEENGNSDSDASSENLNQTAIPFIVRGVAVERMRSKHSSRKNSVSRRVSVGGGSGGQMSDNEFIATLNTLAQGNEAESCPDEKSSDDEEDVVAPTARDIAAKVLEKFQDETASTSAAAAAINRNSSHTGIAKVAEESCTTAAAPKRNQDTTNSAVPENALESLDNVFHTIDEMDKPKSWNEPYEISDQDYSEDEVEVQDEPRTLPATSGTVVKSSTRQRVKTPVYHVIYSRGNRLPGGLGWNDEMRRFYNNSWGGENFDLRDVWQAMNGNKTLWKIYSEDRFPKVRRFSNLKCFNCCEFGHTRAKCKRPKKPMICFMCGESGHSEPRCPHTMCLRCGNKTHVFTKSCNSCTFQNRLICPLCKVRGHTINLCPDKWRRYHSTTLPNEYPNCVVEYKKRKFCCVCGENGHLSENCRNAVRFNEYPLIVSAIKSHQKSYNDQVIKLDQVGIGYNLMYKPYPEFSFELAENTKPNEYYGRFLKAVGLSHLLKRKRKVEPTSSKKIRQHSRSYQLNPYAKKAQNQKEQDTEPEQDPEISESGNPQYENLELEEISDTEMSVPEEHELDLEAGTSAEVLEEEQPEEPEVFTIINEATCEDKENSEGDNSMADNNTTEIDSTFKAPSELPVSPAVETSEPLPLDSDSNYSFSEHFEIPNSSSPKSKSRQMDPLPDFIPLTDDAAEDMDQDEEEDEVMQAGISRKYVTADSEASDAEDQGSPLPDIPCEAKIYLTHFHSKYLLSPDGHAFLTEVSKTCNIKPRLDWTSVGHVLVIFGLPANQDSFHRELLLKYRQLADQMHRKRLENHQKVPKRVDVLIRFLRDSITQLLSNVGNANDLLRRLKHLENQRSKVSFKAAEKVRRSLNMILLGQAGLQDGSLHLDKLLLSLKSLINDFKSDEIAPNNLREDIESHWKKMFTSYRHDNYAQLVQNYNKLISKSRIQKLNIDPVILGTKRLDVSLSAEQKERLEQQTANTQTPKRVVIPTKKQQTTSNVQQNSPPPPAPSMKLKTKTNTTTTGSPNKAPPAPSMKISTTAKNNNSKKQPPSAKPQQRSNVATLIKKVNRNWENKCESLLNEIGAKKNQSQAAGPLKKGLVQNCKEPSMFWSRESLKYLSECIKLADNHELLAKLQRIESKSQKGSLSYNDYRAVIKLHSVILGK